MINILELIKRSDKKIDDLEKEFKKIKDKDKDIIIEEGVLND